MFPRILLRNKTWLMTIEWLGFGRMEVSNWKTQRWAVAPSWLKSHFVNTFHELEKQGWRIRPDNAAVMRMVEAYAGFVLNPEDVIAHTVLSQPPKVVAETIIRNAQSQSPSPPRKPTLPPKPWTYYTWQEAEIACSQCDWSGRGDDAKTGEDYRDGIEKHCPACGYRFGFVLYPLTEEAATDPRASPVDRERARMALSNDPEAVSVLATPDRSIVWVSDASGLSEIWIDGSWGASGYELLDHLSSMLPLSNDDGRSLLAAEARRYAATRRNV